MRIKFKEWPCIVVVERYDNDRIALKLIHAEEGDPIATATINIPEYPVPEEHVLIKDWSENCGMVESLVAAGLIEDTGIKVTTGFVSASLVKLLIPIDRLV